MGMGGAALVLPGTGGRLREGTEGGPLDGRVGGRPGGGPGGGSEGGESVEVSLISELVGTSWGSLCLVGREGGFACEDVTGCGGEVCWGVEESWGGKLSGRGGGAPKGDTDRFSFI